MLNKIALGLIQFRALVSGEGYVFQKGGFLFFGVKSGAVAVVIWAASGAQNRRPPPPTKDSHALLLHGINKKHQREKKKKKNHTKYLQDTNRYRTMPTPGSTSPVQSLSTSTVCPGQWRRRIRCRCLGRGHSIGRC